MPKGDLAFDRLPIHIRFIKDPERPITLKIIEVDLHTVRFFGHLTGGEEPIWIGSAKDGEPVFVHPLSSFQFHGMCRGYKVYRIISANGLGQLLLKK